MIHKRERERDLREGREACKRKRRKTRHAPDRSLRQSKGKISDRKEYGRHKDLSDRKKSERQIDAARHPDAR